MKFTPLALLMGALITCNACANPADYVYTPAVEYGEKEIDFKFGTARQADGTRATASSIGFGYGATEYWFSELYLKHEREGGDGLTLAEWENKFQLTETGKYALDVGLITELEAPLNQHHAPYEFRMGPLFQTEFGKLQLNGNVLFQRQFGPGATDATPYRTEIGYQWQAKYRWRQALEVGLQGMGEMGPWDHWTPSDRQNHRVGPAVFGKYVLDGHHKLQYNAALLFGTSDAAPDHTFRMQMEYEF